MNDVIGALTLELRVQARYGILPVAAGLTALWTAALLATPPHVAVVLAPFLLFVDTVTFGVALLAGLLLFERAEGARAAFAVTPLRTGAYLAAKLVTLTGLAAVSALPIAAAAMRGQADGAPALLVGLALVVAGTVLATLLFLATAVVIAGGTGDLTRFVLLAPLALLPFLAVPLAHLAGLLSHPAAYVVPTTGALEMIRLGVTAAPVPGGTLAGAGYLLLWCVALIAVALRQLRRDLAGAMPREPDAVDEPVTAVAVPGRGATPGEGGAATPAHGPALDVAAPDVAVSRRPRGGVLAALLLIDLRGVGRELMLVVLVAAPILLALALRFGYPPVVGFVAERYGVDLGPYQPLVLVVTVLLHVPVMAGSVGALRVVEDADDHTLAVLRVSPASLERYLGYRLATVTLAALAGLVVAVPLSGLAPGGWNAALVVAVLLAAAQAPLFLLAATAWAGNKVEALATMKVLGVIMLLPVAMWFLPGNTAWALAWLPPFWPVQVLWGDPAAPPLVAVAAGLGLVAVAGRVLLGRTRERLERR